jgi:hypothetical protein
VLGKVLGELTLRLGKPLVKPNSGQESAEIAPRRSPVRVRLAPSKPPEIGGFLVGESACFGPGARCSDALRCTVKGRASGVGRRGDVVRHRPSRGDRAAPRAETVSRGIASVPLPCPLRGSFRGPQDLYASRFEPVTGAFPFRARSPVPLPGSLSAGDSGGSEGRLFENGVLDRTPKGPRRRAQCACSSRFRDGSHKFFFGVPAKGGPGGEPNA